MSNKSPRMRIGEVCECLKCSRDHVYKLNRLGKLKKRNDGLRFAFWIRNEVEKFALGENPYEGEA